MKCSFPKNKYELTTSHLFNEVLALVIIIKNVYFGFGFSASQKTIITNTK